MNERGTIHFVHISDTHIGPTPDFSLYGVRTHQSLEKLIQAINNIPEKPDFIIHTGDVVASPDAAAYRLAARLFKQLICPAYFVAGNHDSAQEIRSYLPMGPKEDLTDDGDHLAYRLDVGGHCIYILDACRPGAVDPRGKLPEEQLEILQQEVQAGEKPLTLFVHFPPLPLDSLWLDREMLLMNGAVLHQTLLPAKHRLRGVFFGHIHRGVQILKDEILYSGVGSTFCQFTSWPHDAKAEYKPDCPAYFHYVTLHPDQTIVKIHGV